MPMFPGQVNTGQLVRARAKCRQQLAVSKGLAIQYYFIEELIGLVIRLGVVEGKVRRQHADIAVIACWYELGVAVSGNW